MVRVRERGYGPRAGGSRALALAQRVGEGTVAEGSEGGRADGVSQEDERLAGWCFGRHGGLLSEGMRCFANVEAESPPKALL